MGLCLGSRAGSTVHYLSFRESPFIDHNLRDAPGMMFTPRSMARQLFSSKPNPPMIPTDVHVKLEE